MQTIYHPYLQCPIFESEQFTYRLVKEEDAQDLLGCYSDPRSAPIFNSDNCTSNFVYHTVQAMQACIRFWLDDYRGHGYVRFSIVEKQAGKAVGTIECFSKPGTFESYGRVGLLRLDLPSRYETESDLGEILGMVDAHLFDCFGVDSMITKSIPEATVRVRALKRLGYQPVTDERVTAYAAYWGKRRQPALA